MPDENKQLEYEGHGNNWHAIVDFDEGGSVGIAKTVCEDPDAIIKHAEDFVGMISLEAPIRAIALLRIDHEKKRTVLDSLYPFFQVHNPVDVEISEIREWGNKAEAVIKGHINGMPVSFFDAFYFVNKKEYKIGNTYQFNLIGLAHSFMKRDENLEFTNDKGPLKGEPVTTRWMTAYMDSEQYGGEFTFVSPFTSFIGSVEAFGSKFQVLPFGMASFTDGGPALSFPIYIRGQIMKGYKPNLNDSVTGSGWLQGYLTDTFRDPDFMKGEEKS